MIDINEVIGNSESFPVEYYEFLRMTIPNVGFFTLMDTLIVRINQDLANLDSSCTDEQFRHKYDKLVLERDIYSQLKRTAEELASTNEER